MELRLLPLILVLFIVGDALALGKSDRKTNVVEKEEEVSHHYETDDELPVYHEESEFDNNFVFETQFPAESITKEKILKEHHVVFGDAAIFSGPSLAYITPWNNRGYDLAKWAAKKFTHISPVWFQIRAIPDSYNCRIDGSHDIDRGWISDVKANGSNIRFVPRVLFDNWEGEHLVGFLQSETWSRQCLKTLLSFLVKEKFDGAVVELWTALMAGTQGKAETYLIELFTMWGEGFRKKNLQLIVPVAPSATTTGPSAIFTQQHLRALAGSVDYVQVMTYDYPGDLGVAPLSWVEECTRLLVEGDKHLASHLMIGLNYYGYSYAVGKHPEPFVENKYLEILRDKESRLVWDPKSGEHYLTLRKTRYNYPSLTSLEARINVARKYGAGIAIWDLGQGLNYFTQTL